LAWAAASFFCTAALEAASCLLVASRAFSLVSASDFSLLSVDCSVFSWASMFDWLAVIWLCAEAEFRYDVGSEESIS